MLGRSPNREFVIYLNRNAIGLLQFKDVLKSVHVGYELTQAFSNYSCRFYIEVKIDDKAVFDEEELSTMKYFFRENQNYSGGNYVSFVYKSKGSSYWSFRVIQNFLWHYSYATTLFNSQMYFFLYEKGVIKIEYPENDPFFKYALKFVYAMEDNPKLDSGLKGYRNVFFRSFYFDVGMHNDIIGKKSEIANFKIEISDIELNEMGADMELTRAFIFENDIPYRFPQYSRTIDKITIDGLSLLNRLEEFDTPIHIRNLIRTTIEERLHHSRGQELRLKELSEQNQIKIDDYVLIKSIRKESLPINLCIITGVKFSDQDQLLLVFKLLNNDFRKSKRHEQEAGLDQIVKLISHEDFESYKNKFRNRDQLLRWFNKN